MLKKILFRGALVSLFLFGMSRFLVSGGGPLESFSSIVLYPFLRLQSVFTSSFLRWKEQKRAHKEVLHELGVAQARCEELLKEVVELKATIDYMGNIRDVRGFFDRYTSEQALVGQIIVRHFGDRHFFLINKGSLDGIEKDMSVVYKNCLVGRISETYPLYSKVMLITDRRFRVAAFCSPTGVQGIYEGTGEQKEAKLAYVNPLDQVNEGETILSSGQGVVFPRGFALGRVKQATRDEIHSLIVLELYLDFGTMDYCVILPHNTGLKDFGGDNDQLVMDLNPDKKA